MDVRWPKVSAGFLGVGSEEARGWWFCSLVVCKVAAVVVAVVEKPRRKLAAMVLSSES